MSAPVPESPPGADFNHLLAQAAARLPDKTALIDSETAVTFAEADRLARRLAAAFGAAGARPGDRLAHILPNSIPLIVTELAALRRGLVKVPLNIRFHPDEVLYALRDCAPAIAVCDERFADALAGRQVDVPGLRTVFAVGFRRAGCASYEEAVSGRDDDAPAHRYQDDEPILIRYTGGTTGRPKGIVHTQRSFRAISLDVMRELALVEQDVTLNVGHLSHGLAFMWGAHWCAGSTQVLRERFEPRAVLEDIERHRVSFVYMVPTMIQRLLREDDGTADVSSLRMFMYASAPMPVPVLRAAIRRYGNIFTQVYTSSETPVITTILRPHEHVEKETAAGGRLASCGRAVPTMELRLLDDGGREVGLGEVGEIVVRSEKASGEPLTLRIGFSGDLSGPYAAYDVPLLNGMEFAAQEINAAGGNVTVEIESKDGKGNQTQTLTAAQELLDDGVLVQVLTTAAPSVAVGQLVTAAGGTTTVGGNTAPSIPRDIGERSVSIVFGDNLQASAMAQYACDQGYATAYLIGSPEIPYTKDIPTFFADAFAQICGGEIVGEDTYKIGQTEFGAQVTKIQNADPAPDAIFSPIFVPDSGAFLKQLRSAGVETPFLSTDGNDSTLFVDSGGSAVDGTVFSTHGFNSPGSEMEAFINAYTEWKDAPPESNTFEAIGRDNVYALVEAASNAGSTEPDAVLEALLQLKDVPLLTGLTTMDPVTRFPTKEVTLVQMDGTTYTELEKVVPSYIAPAQ